MATRDSNGRFVSGGGGGGGGGGADASRFLEGLKEHQARTLAAVVKAVDVFGEHVIGDSQQLTPVLTGALKASGTTTPAVLDGTRVTKEIGHNADYAAAVHERLDAGHPGGGQAKYLETAMRRNAPRFNGFVADEIKKATGG